MSWFANWFDSKYYHILYKNRDEKEAILFINRLIDYLNPKKNIKIIDIGCGKGRHATHLNKLGFDVTGIDLSKNSISKTKSRDKLNFYVHDMRKTYLKNYFDIATNLLTSFGYFKSEKENQDVINSMSENLKQEGLLIIDFINMKNAITNLIPSERKEINNIKFQIKKYTKSNYLIKDIIVEEKKERFNFQEKIKILTLEDFYKMSEIAGLKIINIFGNYQFDLFDKNKSERLILICKKWT